MEQWKHLRVTNGHIPSLLIKSTFGKHGYSIKLTDLSRIWVEKLSKDQIVTRAQKRNCSIDPGEDDSQHQIFLDKLRSSLNQDSKTSLAFSTANDGKLKLHLEAPLPSPLPTFEWQVDFECAHDSDLGAELVSPLLRRAHSLNHNMELLIAELQAKDKIISKITDRLETSGDDLTAVFPGVSNVKLTRNTSQLEQLGRHIRGLGKFDEVTWKAQLNSATDATTLPESSEDAIFASLPQLNAISDDAGKGANWWQQIPVGRHVDIEEEGLGHAPGEADKVSNQLTRQDTSDAGASQHDGFQRQATPSRLRSHSPSKARQEDVEMSGTGGPALSDEDSTEDEDDLDRPSQRSASRRQPTLETVAAQATSEPISPTPPPALTAAAQASTTRGPFTHEEDTEDDDDDDLDGPSQPSQKATSTSQLASRQKSQTPQPTASTATTTTKSSPRKPLGKLGGRLSTKSKSKSPTPLVQEEPSEPERITNRSLPDPQPRPKAKLGIIGGAKAKTQTRQQSPPPPPASSTSVTRSTAAAIRKATGTPEPQPRPKSSRQQPEPRHADRTAETNIVEQTEAERADAKREALKRELEAKAKAPAKKKRKF